MLSEYEKEWKKSDTAAPHGRFTYYFKRHIQFHARATKCVLKAKKFKEIGGYLLDNFKFCSKTRSRNICTSVMELFFCFQTKNETIVEAGESSMARDLNYTHYYKVWSNLIVAAIIPIGILVLCNTMIFIQLRKSRIEMASSRQVFNNQHQNGAAVNTGLARLYKNTCLLT